MKKLFTLALASICGVLYSQNFKVEDYPIGVYETYEDFRIKKPSSTPSLSEASSKDNLAYRFDNLDDKSRKLKKAFAVSDGKNLYIQVVNLIKKFDSEDRGQGYDGGVYFLKAENHGGYLFLKDYFVSNSSAMWGGLIAAAAARRQKGVIYNESKESFNLFKNLEDFQSFMTVEHPNVTLDLERGKGADKKEEIDVVISNLDKINS